MTDKLPNNQAQPIVKIGHYTLGATLGVGTFGKVKSKSNSLYLIVGTSCAYILFIKVSSANCVHCAFSW